MKANELMLTELLFLSSSLFNTHDIQHSYPPTHTHMCGAHTLTQTSGMMLSACPEATVRRLAATEGYHTCTLA